MIILTISRNLHNCVPEVLVVKSDRILDFYVVEAPGIRVLKVTKGTGWCGGCLGSGLFDHMKYTFHNNAA